MKEIKTKKQAEDFCDKYIELVDTIIQFNNSYRGEITPCTPHPRCCHIYRGIEHLAELLGLEAYEKPFSANNTKIYFNYKDVEFFELKKGEGNEG